MKLDFWNIVLIIAVAIIVALLVWPLWSILSASFIDNETGAFTLANYDRVLFHPFFQRALQNSILVGFGGMLGSMLLGIPLAFVTTRFRIFGRDLIATAAVLALVSPPFIGAYAWIMLLGQNGMLRGPLEAIGIPVPSIYGMFGIILVFSLKFFPFVYLMTSSALGTINPSLEEAAEGLGAGAVKRFWRITLPLVFPAASSGALLAFILSVADFGTPSIVGGEVRVLATVAYNLFTSEMGGNPGVASATSMVLIVLSMLLVIIQRWAVRRRNISSALVRKPVPKQLAGLQNGMAHGIAYLIVLAGSLPSLIVVWTSFRKTSGPVFQPGLGLDSYAKIIREVPQVITNSFVYSALSVVMIVVLGTAIGYLLARRESLVTGILDSTLLIPYVVPGVVMGLGYVVTFNQPPLVLVGTGTIIVLMLFIRRLPYSVRAAASILKQIRGSMEEAAVSLGAGPGRAFMKVTLPVMLPGVIAGALMSFITAINELSSSLILYVGRTMTMPVRIYLSVLDGEFGTAAALSTILLVTTGVCVFVVFKITGQKEGAFA